MATFSDRPTEFEFPWFTKRTAYDNSLEAAINAIETAASDAQGVADKALPVRPVIASSTVNIDTLLELGVYPVWAAGGRDMGYPVPSGSRGILEVIPYSPSGTYVLQRYTLAHATHKGSWTRWYNAATWTAWTFAPTQRIDNTAGRAIYTWDDTQNREQLIYGDTGWRDISSLLNENWEVNPTSGACLIKRDKQRVVLKLRLRLKEGAPFIGTARNSRAGVLLPDLPQGFANSLYAPVIGLGEGPASSAFSAGTTALLTSLNFVGFPFNTGSWAAGDTLNGEFSWETNNTWPTTLPGTAVGTIPFN